VHLPTAVESPPDEDKERSSVLERAVRLLDALRQEERSLALVELSKLTGLPKPTAYRLATQLVNLGLLSRVDGRYRPGLRLFEFASVASNHTRFRETALPFLEDLYEATHETVHLGVRVGVDVLYIDKITGHRYAKVSTRIGTRKPLYCTGLGKALLAHSSQALFAQVVSEGLTPLTPYTICDPRRLKAELAQVLLDGVAYDRQEYELGITCVAAPVRDRQGRLLGAVSITGPVARFRPEQFSSAVRTASLGIGRSCHLAAVFNHD
jgi:DNA-binding IclR family transcriptional regulator